MKPIFTPSFQTLYHAAPFGVILLDISGSILSANPAAQNILRLSPEHLAAFNNAASLTLANFEEHKEYLGLSQPQIQALRSGQPLENIQLYYTNPLDGEQMVLKGSVIPQAVNPGEPPELLMIVFEDITRQVKQDEAKVTGEERFALLFQKHDAVMLLIDPETGSIVDANLAAQKYYGYSLDALREMNIADINMMPPEEIAFQRKRAARESLNFFIFPHRLASGEVRTVEVHSSPISIGGKTILFSIIHDITARAQAEQALRQSEDKFSKAFYDSSVARLIARIDNGLLVDVNTVFLSLFEFRREEVIGRTPTELNIYMAPETRDEIVRQLKERGEVKAHERKLRTKSGRIIDTLYASHWIELNNQPHHIVTLVDITDRIAAEQALQKALRAKNEFMAAISHELRTPLNGILGLSEAMLENIYGAITDRQRNSIYMIERNGKRLLRLINDVIDFSRLQAGDLSLDITDCSLANVCLASIYHVQAKADAKHQKLNLSIPSDPIQVKLDERRMVQVLENLLDNAIKFTPENGTISLVAEVLPEQHQVQIQVIDTGIGIGDDYYPRLFQPFVQEDAGLSRQYEGTGLGLALVKGLVDLHLGTVTVASAPGKGSTFTVLLPW